VVANGPPGMDAGRNGPMDAARKRGPKFSYASTRPRRIA
jgi:hypothetical protein